MTQDDTLLLVRRAQSGDRLAFQHLLEGHYTLMHRVAYRFTGHAADAEDVAQEVCMALVYKLAQFKGDSQFSTWLYRVVVNACRDYIKKNGNRRALEGGYRELEAHADAEAQELRRKQAWLYAQIAQMGDDLRETALLVLAEQQSHAEAADIMGCAESTISWRMAEIRKALKQAIGGYHE